MKQILWVSLCIIFFSCQNEADYSENQNISGRFELLSPTQTGIQFHNRIEESPNVNHLNWEAIYNGGGVATGDINNDGLADVFLTGNQVADALYLNRGNFQFEDISKSSGIDTKNGWSTGVSMVDINGDGWLDIYVNRSWWDVDAGNEAQRANLLWINNQNGTFSEKGKVYGLDDIGYSTQACFFDYDLDGDLDCYVLNTPSHNLRQKLQYAQNQAFPYFTSDHLYQNNGNVFVDVTKEADLECYAYGLGIVSMDINFDAYPDLYIANDFEKPDRFLVNNRDGTFRDEIHDRLKHISLFSMGVDAADFNNDGYLDISVLDMQTADHYRAKTNMKSMNVKEFWRNVGKGFHYQYMSNMLQMNRGAGFFSEIGQFAGIAKTDWSWSILMADFDNDSYADVFVTNGINKDIRNNDFLLEIEGDKGNDLLGASQKAPSQPLANYVFQNNGNLTFEDVSRSWNLNQEGFSHGAAYADLDLDGDLDLVVNNSSEPAFVYENQIQNNANWLRIKIKGWGKNTRGLGTKAIVHFGGEKLYQDLTNVRGFQSSSEAIFHFGLGKHQKADTLFVIFPNGKMHRLNNVATNQLLELEYTKTNDIVKALPYQKPLFTKLEAAQTGLDFTHKENPFDDFAREILLPHRQSTQGPFISTGDVNDDNLQDVFVGGASGQAGILFMQKEDGSFKVSQSKPWTEDADAEDMASALFDFENDGDLDLFIVSGGSEYEPQHEKYRDRLYLNGGKGDFKKSIDAHPDFKTNGSCLIAEDYDQDGDIDLFIGGHGKPGHYPMAGNSHIYLWHKPFGKFIESTNKFAHELSNTGMVTDAVWADLDGDAQKDLVVVGEWMAPTIFKNKGGYLSIVKSNNANIKTGWWQSILAEDIDKDGDIDLICGNIGLNNKYKASDKKPLLVYGSDFDQNETNDVVLAKVSEKGVLPVRGRECSSEQMPFISDKFPTFDAFAKATVPEILGEENLKDAVHYEAKESRSGLFRNDNGDFEFIPFPNLAQIAPVMDMLAIDLNNDDLKDLIIVGNLFGAEVETVRHDASNGLVLINKGNAQFEPMPMMESGFYVPGNARSIAKVETQKGALILVGVNDNKLESFLIDPNSNYKPF